MQDSVEPNEVAAIFLLREDGALLMQHRDNKPGLSHAGMWTPPGGHREAGEAIESCARRELREETGYDCSELSRLTSLMDDHVAGHPPYLLTVFCARYDGTQPLRCLEGQALEFIEREQQSDYEIPQYLIAIWDQAIAALRKQLENAQGV